VLEDQIAENGKRADVHPLEEADAYRRLHEEHGREVDEIAELTGKSKAYVYAAMKLCALSAEPRARSSPASSTSRWRCSSRACRLAAGDGVQDDPDRGRVGRRLRTAWR
jgi:ParB/RepB/Spo0J family partition protein